VFAFSPFFTHFFSTFFPLFFTFFPLFCQLVDYLQKTKRLIKIRSVVVAVNKIKATYSCVCLCKNRGQQPGAAVSGFFVGCVDHRPKFAVNEVGLRTQPMIDNSA